MKLTPIDILIIGIYLLSTVFIGLYLKKRAQKDKTAYILGGKTLPWYLLGLSNASGMFDISGTMWLVTLAFVYGLKSIWIPWLWPVFNQIFLMCSFLYGSGDPMPPPGPNGSTRVSARAGRAGSPMA
jgi:SSS family solute:Na+ symporter